MKRAVRVERCTWMESQPGGKHAHTFTAVLLLDLSNDAMVKWCVTKSILQEIWERKGEERMRTTCRATQSLRGPIQDSPFSVSFTWFSHSSYLASSWNRNKRQLVTMATDSAPVWIIDTFQIKHFRCCNCNHNTTYMSTQVKVTCVKPEIDHIEKYPLSSPGPPPPSVCLLYRCRTDVSSHFCPTYKTTHGNMSPPGKGCGTPSETPLHLIRTGPNTIYWFVVISVIYLHQS